MAAALDGITVLDLSTVGPAARCTRILADYGARVVKLGAPAKSGVNTEPPFFAYSAGRGMQRMRLDLKQPEGVAVFLRLAERADVVVESFRPGVVARLGIGYADVRRRNPRIVYCSTSGYGQQGPRARWAGHDLNYLAVSGYLDCSGRRADGGPPLPGATVADGAAGGMHAAIAILAALLRRGHAGEGEYLDVSVADGALSLMALAVDEHLATGEPFGPGHDILTGRYACYDTYAARDGRWLAVAAIEPAFWANLCKALGLERWIAHQTDDACQDEIRSHLRAAFRTRDRDAWVAELSPNDTCVAPVQSVAEAAADPQFAARAMFCDAQHPQRGKLRQVAPALAGMPRPERAPALPVPGSTETDALLAEAGYAPAEIASLRASGAVA
ncbi:MAG TPA: CaiB/BaiF CoA-transferase family protein [Myxococcota bacterium]|nr:CaiB/BaiF CoA-transferase family protein [Myxococcota bacterium]